MDLEDLQRKIDSNTAAIFLNNPSNPCGSVYSEQHLRDILAVAEKYRLPIISDEIYDGMVSEPLEDTVTTNRNSGEERREWDRYFSVAPVDMKNNESFSFLITSLGKNLPCQVKLSRKRAFLQ